MTTQHTPGPWEVSSQNFYLVIAGGLWITDCETFDRAPEESEANARLIAAAPDLLLTLQTIALHAPSLDTVGIRDLCDQAIAKATQP